jgi:hypothetical protein
LTAPIQPFTGRPKSFPFSYGTTLVGDYHTHGDYSITDFMGNAVRTSDVNNDSFKADNFSARDYGGIEATATANFNSIGTAYRGYLGTPSGLLKTFNPWTGARSRLFGSR